MKLPNLSESMYVARLRYIQSIHEPSERRNPDTLVRHFIPLVQRWRSAWLGRDDLNRLRAQPFYHYLVARTKYYDDVVRDAVADGVGRIVIVGCGSDTRAYRFQPLLAKTGVRVLECDQPQAIQIKQRMIRKWSRVENVTYLPIDLNDDSWPEFERWLGESPKTKTLVLMEGVSVYVNTASFTRFLRFLATQLCVGSHLAYDYKIRGVSDDEGRVGRTLDPFRLPAGRDDVTAFHQQRGLRLEHFELSSDLTVRLLTNLASNAPLFSEDGLVRLLVA